MLKKLFKRVGSDKADSSMISVLLFMPFVLVILITMLDSSIYFANRSQISQIAANGARTVAIMGGNGTSTQSTPIEAAYGAKKATACGAVKSTGASYGAKNSSSTTIECNVMVALQEQIGLINTKINSVKCSPNATVNIGDRTSCEIKWNYNGLPMSSLTLLRGGDTSKPMGDRKPTLANESITAASSEAEVRGLGLVTRK